MSKEEQLVMLYRKLRSEVMAADKDFAYYDALVEFSKAAWAKHGYAMVNRYRLSHVIVGSTLPEDWTGPFDLEDEYSYGAFIEEWGQKLVPEAYRTFLAAKAALEAEDE